MSTAPEIVTKAALLLRQHADADDQGISDLIAFLETGAEGNLAAFLRDRAEKRIHARRKAILQDAARRYMPNGFSRVNEMARQYMRYYEGLWANGTHAAAECPHPPGLQAAFWEVLKIKAAPLSRSQMGKLLTGSS